ncbi:hypothetical protein ACR777_15140 [Sphingobacterium spiritivorum]|uniref:hypothetical protein n=1 Tax=Sphingobacterium spiritivorum TaxID=258 RepID=UPI003DA1D3D9
MSYDNITDLKQTFVDGQENASGLQEVAYFIPLTWIKTFAKVASAGTTAASIVELVGDHVMETGKSPIKIQMLYSKSGAQAEMEGEELSKVFRQGPAEFFLPNINATNLGTATAIKNYRGIVLIKRIGGGEWYQIGSEELAAQVSAGTVSFGTGPTGEVGIKTSFQAYSHVPFFVYKGELPVTGV